MACIGQRVDLVFYPFNKGAYSLKSIIEIFGKIADLVFAVNIQSFGQVPFAF